MVFLCTVMSTSRALRNPLLPKLAPLWAQSAFEQVFIEHGKQFVRFSPDWFETRSLNDLWHKGNRDGLP